MERESGGEGGGEGDGEGEEWSTLMVAPVESEMHTFEFVFLQVPPSAPPRTSILAPMLVYTCGTPVMDSSGGGSGDDAAVQARPATIN